MQIYSMNILSAMLSDNTWRDVFLLRSTNWIEFTYVEAEQIPERNLETVLEK